MTSLRFERGPRKPVLAFASVAVVAFACQGAIGEGGDPEPPAADGVGDGRAPGLPAGAAGTSNPASGTAPGAASCAQGPLPARRIVKLTDREYATAVRDLLGAPGAALDVHTPGASPDAFLQNHEALRVDDALASQYQRAAESIAADAARRAAQLLPCPPETARADACVRGWIQSFVVRAFRRPLAADEVDDYARLYEVGAASGGSGAGAQGLRLVLTAVLQAPSFLYRTELGRPAPSNGSGRVALTDHELAAQLSFWLLESLPDPPLWQAAAAGKLSDPAVVKAEATRLLAIATVKDRLSEALLRYYDITELAHTEKDPKLFPTFPTLRTSLIDSARRFVGDILWSKPSDVAALYTSRAAFVDTKIAKLYGVPAPTTTSFVRVDAPVDQRSGILTHPAFLAQLASPIESHVVRRGAFVRREVLCQALVPPPDGLNVADAGKGLTERQFAEFRAAQPACGACHAMIDPFGLMFETYDAVGAFRTSQAGRPIDTTARVAGTDFDGEVKGALDLAARLGKSALASSCTVNQILSHALGRWVEPGGCGVERLHRAYVANGRQLAPLVADIAGSDEFRFRQP